MPKPRQGKTLSIKEEKFVENMADPSATSPRKAAKAAGYSEKTSSQIANENLNKPYIIAAIEKRKAEVAQHANITPEQVLGATALRAFATIDDALDDNGNLDVEKARKTGAIHLIKKISRNQGKYGENVAVEFYSNESAQDKLGSYLGMDKMPAPNPAAVEKVFEAYNLWLADNPKASAKSKTLWINRFAKSGGVETEALAERAGVQMLNTLQ